MSSSSSPSDPLLRPHAAREVTEVIHRQRQIGQIRFPNGLAVIVGFDGREKGQILFHAIRNAVQDGGTRGHRGAAPAVRGCPRGIDGQLDILRL